MFAGSTIVHALSRHFTASAVVIDADARRVLLIDHKASGLRQFPGGHVDPDETGDEAAIREVREETGVIATVWTPTRFVVPGARRVHPTPFMVAEFPAPPKPHKGEPAHHHIDLLYIATADSSAPMTTQLAEVDGAVWLPLDNLAVAAVRADVPPVATAAWKALTGQTL
ncbi:NUDIX domain-containing protein [Micromonospora sp. WMMD882]|uniref:NUDIX hydrolase n=1 Tax=Micromonospora sp. WMMD882 TaxID=3015151 RepID=UPI00248CCD0D|nr:NUDIX domain-containing protein [Micromonospora sp. WMMD882]WBB81286.1 NUDIX domain-containing protein [Micromonospora sp. WMMD882]